jgi:hypothetical protein
MLKAVHLPRWYKKSVPRLKAVTGVALHKLALAALDEIQLVLRMGLLRVLAARRIQLGAHAAMRHQRCKAFAVWAGQLPQS